jgi:hypothetical protein
MSYVEVKFYHKDVGTSLSKAEWEGTDVHYMPSGTSFPLTPTEGQMFYRTDTHKQYQYNGSTWVDLTSSPGSIGEDLLPSTANIYDLGSPTYEWNTAYIGTGKIYFYTDQYEAIHSDGTGLVFTTANSSRWKIEDAGHFVPTTANSYNIGSPTAEVSNIYVGSGRIYFAIDQGESIRSDGASVIIAISTTDKITVGSTNLNIGGLNITNPGTGHDTFSDYVGAEHLSLPNTIANVLSASGLTVGYVIRASGATTFVWTELQHSDLGGVTSDLHHAQQHTLSGGDHTGDLAYTQIDDIVAVSGGGSTTTISRSDHVHTSSDGSSKVTYSNLDSIPSTFTPSNHDIITTHTDSGLTIGYVIRASGATTFTWAQLSHSDLNDDETNQHIDHTSVTITAGAGLIYSVGGTDISASATIDLDHLGFEDLTDPGGDKVLFWDDATPDALQWLTISTGLSLSTTNLTTDDSQINHNSLSNTHNLTTDIDHDSLTNTHNLTTDIDHNSLTNTHNMTTDIDARMSGGTGITYTAGAIALDLNELTTSISDGDGDYFAVIDIGGVQKKLTKININLGGFNNDQNWSSTTGTVTSIAIGDGLTGTTPITTSGTITLGTGGTVTQGSTNAVTGSSHTHAWTHTSSGNWDSAWTHANGSTGADHTYINQSVTSGASPTFVDITISTPSNIYSLSHDSFADFSSSEHFLQTAIVSVSTGLSGLLKATTGTLSTITDSSSNWNDAHTHISADGSSHTYINQDVTTTGIPSFTSITAANFYVGTGKYYMAADNAEYIDSTGSAVRVAVGSSPLARFTATSFEPITDGGYTLGDTSERWGALHVDIIVQDEIPDASLTCGAGSIVIVGTAAEALAQGDAVYKNSASKWAKADADSSTSMGDLGMATTAISADATGIILRRGYWRNDAFGLTFGGFAGQCYVSQTAGWFTQTAPTGAGTYVQVIGYAHSATVIYFNPGVDVWGND